MKKKTTPYYLLDERKLLRNLKIIRRVRAVSGAKSVLALKCFSTWCVFPLMRKYMDGTTSSSLFEARLGYEKFGKEVHAYSVGFSARDIRAVRKFADKVIFNSISQLRMYHGDVRGDAARGLKVGLRVNPGISYSHFDLADPARKYSRLGVSDKKALRKISALISGVMFHFNCENDDFRQFSSALDFIGRNYSALLKKLEWVSLGGGLAFTKDGYPLEKFCFLLQKFSEKFGVQVYLEPGEAVITNCAELVTTVLDVVHNEVDIAIVDASTEAHMLDHLVYRTSAKIAYPGQGRFKYIIAGRSCLAGDVFGQYRLKTRLKPGSVIRIADAAGYTMVKKNWFNGLPMPSICVRRLDGTLDTVRSFEYKDYINSLS
ncbi:MAG: carboxynorspermidine decarboxylase [Kiritimatiellia bacterium]|nr:carboxynorspermidine decarboxylase [Kiritimatiellia bacterium]